MGTVLLAEYAEIAAARGWICVPHECSESESDGAVALAALHRRLRDAMERLSLARRLERLAGDVVARARDLIGSMQLESQGISTALGERGRRAQFDPAVEERVEAAMEGLGEVAVRSGAPGVIF